MRPWRSNAGGLVGNGCVADVRSPGAVDCGTGRSSIGHTGTPGAAIEHVGESLLAHLRHRLDAPGRSTVMSTSVGAAGRS